MSDAIAIGTAIHEAVENGATVEEVVASVKPVSADKLPADIIMQQLGYRTRVVPKRKDQKHQPQRTESVKHGSNGRVINAFDTFWANVRSVSGLKRIRRGRKVRTKSAPINGKTAPVGAIHRGARGSDATHLLATLGKEGR